MLCGWIGDDCMCEVVESLVWLCFGDVDSVLWLDLDVFEGWMLCSIVVIEVLDGLDSGCVMVGLDLIWLIGVLGN